MGEILDFTIIGQIINTHGIKGELKVYPLTNDVNRFDKLKSAYLGTDKIPVNITGVKYHKEIVILRLKEFNDINEVIKFKSQYIYVDEENKVVLPEDNYFISDLIGCRVIDTESNPLGIIKDVLQGYSNDVYVVLDDSNKKEYLLPAVKEFIKQVDIKDKLVVVDPIEGMIE